MLDTSRRLKVSKLKSLKVAKFPKSECGLELRDMGMLTCSRIDLKKGLQEMHI